MLQAKEIEKKFMQIQNEIGAASKLCLNDKAVSSTLKDSLTRLNKKSILAK